MSEKNINIKFNTKADTTGAKQTAEALKEVQKVANESGAGAFDSYVKGAEKARQQVEQLKEALGSITSIQDTDPFANAAKDTARDLDVLLQKQRELLAASRESMDIAGMDEATNKIKELSQAYDQLFNSRGQVADPSAEVQAVIDAYGKRTAAAEKAFDREEAAAAKALEKEIANNQKATDSANKYFETYATGQARIKMSLQQLYAEQERYNNKLKEATSTGDAAGIKDSVENLKRLETQINTVTRRAEVSDRRMAIMVNRFRAMSGGAIQATSALSGMNGALGQTASLASSALQGAMFGGAWGAAFGVAVKGVELFISKLQEADQASEAFYKAQADKALAADKELREIYNRLGEQRQEQALKRYSNAIDDIKNKWDEASRATANHLSTLEAIADLRRQETDLMFAEGKSKLDQRLAEGTISQDQYDREMITLRTNSTLQQVDNERASRDLQRKGHYEELKVEDGRAEEANNYIENYNLKKGQMMTPEQFKALIMERAESTKKADSSKTELDNLFKGLSEISSIDIDSIESILNDSSSLGRKDFREEMKRIFSMAINPPDNGDGPNSSYGANPGMMDEFLQWMERAKDLKDIIPSEIKQADDKGKQIDSVKSQAGKLGADTTDTQDAESYERWFNSVDDTVKKMEDVLNQAHARIEEIMAKLDKMDQTEPLFEGNAKRRENIALRDQETANTTRDKESAIDNKEQAIKDTQDEIARLKELKKQAKLNNKQQGGQENAALETFKRNLLNAAAPKQASLGKKLPDTLFSADSPMGEFIKEVSSNISGGITVEEEQAIDKKFRELVPAFRKQFGNGNRQFEDDYLNKVHAETNDLITKTKAGGEEAFADNQIAELERKVAKLEKEKDDIKTGKNKTWLKPIPEAKKPKKEKEITPIVEEVKTGADGVKQAVESSQPEMGQIATSFGSLGQTIIASNQSVSQAITSAVGSVNGIKSSFSDLKAHADRMQQDLINLNRDFTTFAKNTQGVIRLIM